MEQLSNRIRYTGQQYDGLTGQYYLRARYYNPVLGRFLQEDVYQGDGLNLYAYCVNNPVVYFDPSGYAKGCNESNHSYGQGDSSRGHEATWEHLDEHGNVIDSGTVQSGGTHPGRSLTWEEQLATHTERKIIDELSSSGTVLPGDTIVICGTRPPCNPGRSMRPSRGCQKAMQDFANMYNVIILYFVEGDPFPWIFPR